MKNKKMLALLASALLAFGASAYAQSFTATCDSQAGEVKVSIKPDDKTYSAPITVYLTKSGVKIGDINADNIGDAVKLFAQVAKGADGYEATLKLPAGIEKGFYTFTVEDYGARNDVAKVALADRQSTVYVGDSDDVEGAIAAVNGATTLTIGTAFTTHKDTLCIDTDLDFGTSTNKAFIALKGNKTYTTLKEIQNDYAVAQAIGGLTDATPATMGDKLNRYASVIGIELDEDYEDNKAEAHELMAKYFDISAIDAGVKETYKKLAREAVAVAAINGTDRTGIDAVLNKYNDVFKVDLDGKYATTNKTSFNKALERKSFADAAAVKKAFDAAVKNLGKQSGGESSSSGGSSIKYEPNKSEDNTPTAPGAMKDLSQAEWAREAIEALIEQGIISGYPTGEFKPNNTITRNEVLAILVRAFGLADETAVYDFVDGDPDGWYANAVASAKKKKIITGYADGSFGDGVSVTRQDMAVFIYRMGLTEKSEGNSFKDNGEIADYAREAVDSLSNAGIINGMGDGKFEPNAYATRAQFVKIVYDVMGGGANE